MPTVSFICSFYNRPGLVRRTLVGMARQTYRDAEFVILDDGSTDETPDNIEQTIEQLGDPRFRFVRLERNSGLTKVLVEAVSKTDSRYFAIHDAGDYSSPARLARQVAAIEADPDVVVVGSHYINYVEDVGLSRLREPCADRATFADILIDPTFTHGEVLVDRAAYTKAGGYRASFRYAQDNDLWLRMIHHGRFHTVPAPLYVRCIQFSGISYGSTSFPRQSAFYVLGKHLARRDIDESVLRDLDGGMSIFDILSKSDPEVQRVIVRGALRALAFGSPDSALATARESINSPLLRCAVSATAGFFATPIGRKLLRSYWRFSGLTDVHPLVAEMNAIPSF